MRCGITGLQSLHIACLGTPFRDACVHAGSWGRLPTSITQEHQPQYVGRATRDSLTMGLPLLRQPASVLPAKVDSSGYWRNRYLLVIFAVCGWGFAWAIGCSVVFFVGSAFGWLALGTTGGLVTGLMLHWAQPSLRTRQFNAVIIGWALGGAAAVPVTDHDVFTGWLVIGAVGGTITGLALLGTKRGFASVRTITVAVGWVLGGVIGLRLASTGGRVIGTYLAGTMGRLAPFMVWAIAWAIAGGVTGLIGAVATPWAAGLSGPKTAVEIGNDTLAD